MCSAGGTVSSAGIQASGQRTRMSSMYSQLSAVSEREPSASPTDSVLSGKENSARSAETQPHSI